MNLRLPFVPALSVALSLVVLGAPVAAQTEVAIERRPVEVVLYDVRSAVPTDWADLGQGRFARGTPPEDLAMIVLQAAEASKEQIWEALLPMLALSEAPEATGELATERFDWSLHRVDAGIGEVAIAVEIALSERDGRTSLVLFQAAPDEFDVLRSSVFIPALEAFATLEPAVTPHPSTFAYQIEEVVFPGGSEGVELAGTLTLPSTPGPHPVVVLMSGSGAQDRDESLKPLTTLQPFAEIADALTSAGVGVLRYDDRGKAGSTGDYAAATVGELAGDGRAAIDYLETRGDVDASRIGLLGHSEGGFYAAMLAAADPDIAFVVAMAPGVVDGVELLIAQNEAILRSGGETEELIGIAIEYASEILPLARDGDIAAIEEIGLDHFGSLWDRQGPDERAVLGERDAFVQRSIEMQVATVDSDWMRSLLAYDPRPDWEQVTVPVLGLFGAKDVQVVLEQNEPALRAALRSAGNEDVETAIFPNANHLFQEAVSGAMQEYQELEPEFTADFLPTLVDWVTVRAGVAE